jgi:hypothetical protein
MLLKEIMYVPYVPGLSSQEENSYLCNKLGNVIFFRIRHGIFESVYEKKWIPYVLHT